MFDTPPVVDLVKSVDHESLDEPGGVFTFTLTVTNNGTEDFTITELTDSNLAAPYPAEVAGSSAESLSPGAVRFRPAIRSRTPMPVRRTTGSGRTSPT